jgi:secretion/DNA translocation related CpaE-like protein
MQAGAADLRRRDGVVLIGSDLDDAGIYARGMKLGAEEVVVLRDADDWLVRRIADALEGDGSAAFVVGVIGGRGGAGATTLAVALSMSARRRGHRTLLVDADPLGGGVDLVLGGEDARGLRWSGLADTRGRVSAAALQEALPKLCDLSVLSFDRADPFELSESAMRAVLDAGCRVNDVVVVDLPRRLDDPGRIVLDRADLTLLVVPAEIRATAAAARVVAAAGMVAADMRVVVRGPSPSKLPAQTVAGCLGLPLAADLRAEPNIAVVLERGVPPARRGRGPLATFCMQLLEQVLPDTGRSAAA